MTDEDQTPSRSVLDERRAAMQYLQSLRRAGLTHLPKPSGQLPVSEITPESKATSAPATRTQREVSSSSPSLPQQPAARGTASGEPSPRMSRPAQPPASADQRRESPASSNTLPKLREGAELSRTEREQQLTALAACVAGCERCPELARTRTQTVFGVGNPEARIMFIGEAPGADEDRLGEPFVGRAGQLLDRIIEACRMKREDIYICNVLRCRPPGNRTPSAVEANNCREYLDGQIKTVNPEYIVCWGSVAAQNLLDTKVPIGRLRKKFHQHGRAKVLCTYHPSYLLRNPAAKKDVWEDMQFFFEDMGVDLSAK